MNNESDHLTAMAVMLSEGDASDAIHPARVHHILSQVVYGEEDEAFLQSISLEVALQVPWTTQLRLCLRSPTTLHKLLLPHVWNKVQKHLNQDDHLGDDDAIHSDDSWKQDRMMQHWRVTRFHIQRDLRLIPDTLRKIMEHIDSLLNCHDEPTLHYDGDYPIFQIGRSPSQIIQDFQNEIKFAPSSKPVTVHPKFTAWVDERREGNDQILLDLCRKIGLNRTRLKLMEDQLHNLPLHRMARGLLSLRSNEDETVRKGMTLLAALLKRHGVDIALDPLPSELMLGSTHQLMDTIKSFLQYGLPNVNSLVVSLWAHQSSMDVVGTFASWLPVEPVVPLLQRSLSLRDNDDWELGIDFFLALTWEPHHLHEIFEPLLGSKIPTDPSSLKQSCRMHMLGKQPATKPMRHAILQLSTSRLVEKAWGKARVIFNEAKKGIDNDDLVRDDHYSDDDFDETDDRVLLL